MLISLARAGSWEELLQLLPLAGEPRLFLLVEEAAKEVVMAHSIAAGEQRCWGDSL
jgi:hypothetical protein